MCPIDPRAPLGTYESYFILFMELVRTLKVDATITKLDGLPVGRHFQNGRHRNQWNYIFACNSVYRIDRCKILVSRPMFMQMRNPMITLPVGRHFQNGRHRNQWNYIFACNSVYRIDRCKILLSRPMFMQMRNPMITLKKTQDSCLTQNSKWLLQKPAEITLISQWGPILAIYPTCTSQERTKAMSFGHWDLSQHEKSMPPPLNWDGLPTCIQRHFQKWPPAK